MIHSRPGFPIVLPFAAALSLFAGAAVAGTGQAAAPEPARSLPVTVGAPSPTAGEPGPDSTAGEQASAEVTALLAEQAAAWSRGDLEAMTSVYADDALFLSPTGLTRGRAAVLARYRVRYSDPAAMGRLTLEVLETRPFAGAECPPAGDAPPGRVQAVSVAARWTLSYPKSAGREDATGLTLLVLRRRSGGGWEIVQDASM